MNEEAMNDHATPVAPSRFGDLALYITFAVAFLIPFFVVPSNLFPVQFSKIVVVLIGSVVILGLFLYRTLRAGTFSLSWSPLSVSVWLIPLAYLIALPFSSHFTLSFLGYELGADTFGFVLLMSVFATLTALSVPKKSQVLVVFTALLFSGWAVFAFQAVQLIFHGPFPFLPDPSSNLIGGWNDFGVFAGFIGALSLLAYESMPLPSLHQRLLAFTVVASIIFLSFVNFSVAWILFGIVALAVLVFSLSKRFLGKDNQSSKWGGVLPAVGLIAAVVFILFGSGISGALQQAASINVLQVRPTFQSTINVLNGVYAADPIFGSGTNTFEHEWLLYRSSGIVQTPFWNSSFSNGSSAVLTSIATGGLVVSAAWVLFILVLLYTVGRALFMGARDQQSYTVVLFSSLAVLYLLIADVLYAPSQSVMLLLFLAVGLFMSASSDLSFSKSVTFNLKLNPRYGFAFVFIGVALMLLSVASLYVVGTKYVSVYFHNRAVTIANQGNLEGGFKELNTAVRLDSQDRYYRTAALMSLADLSQIVQSGDTSETAQNKFQTELASAVQSTAVALQKDPKSYANLMTRALVFESVIPLGIDGAFDNAVTVYNEARTLNPLGPEVDLRLARMYTTKGDTETARTYVNSALAKKPDYTDAILYLAQLELDDGDLKKAIESVRGAVYFEPQNPTLLYQLGILLLQDKNYESAATALGEAVRLQPNFANAKFFLAQSDAFLNRFDEATTLMEELVTENPDNTFVAGYRDALKKGTNPFETTPTPPADKGASIE